MDPSILQNRKTEGLTKMDFGPNDIVFLLITFHYGKLTLKNYMHSDCCNEYLQPSQLMQSC